MPRTLLVHIQQRIEYRLVLWRTCDTASVEPGRHVPLCDQHLCLLSSVRPTDSDTVIDSVSSMHCCQLSAVCVLSTSVKPCLLLYHGIVIDSYDRELHCIRFSISADLCS